MMRETTALDHENITTEHAWNTILSGFAAVKMISMPDNNDRYWIYNLKQLAEPESYRPIKHITDNEKKTTRFNPKTGELSERDVTHRRGTNKITRFTKKTDVTLLPKDGVISLFTPKYKSPIGLLLDINQCHLKDEKYIFEELSEMDKRWWLIKSKHASSKLKRSISLKKLQSTLEAERDHDIIPRCNSMSIGLSKAAVIGITVPENTVKNRLKAIHAQTLIEKYLRQHAPIFIVTIERGIEPYSREQQVQDQAIDEPLCVSTAQSTPKWSVHDTNHIIFSFLDRKNIARLALVSTSLRMQSEADQHWGLPSDDFVFSSKAEYGLYYLLIKKNVISRSMYNEYGDRALKVPYRANQGQTFVNNRVWIDRERLMRHIAHTPETAYKIMHTDTIRGALPERDTRPFSLESRSLINKLLSATAGFILAAIIGGVITTRYIIESALRLARGILTCGICFNFSKVSTFRSLLGISLLPIISILSACFIGAYCGWTLGLSKGTPTMLRAITSYSSELFRGIPVNHKENEVDSFNLYYPGDLRNREVNWERSRFSLFENTRSTIHRDQTIADIADEVETNKPASLRN